MNPPLKVGDRVAVYAKVRQSLCPGVTSSNEWCMNGTKGEVIKMHPSGWIDVLTSYGTMLAHPKQCRRLKPRAKPREFFIPHMQGDILTIGGKSVFHEQPAHLIGTTFYHVREVLKK